jgi:iron complex outermembrane receptor protein
MSKRRAVVFVAAGIAALASGLDSALAGEAVDAGSAADAGAPASSAGLEEIVVTARRRSENNQKTPVSITALQSQDLENHGVTSIRGLTSEVPSLSLQSSNYDSFGGYIGIRGQQATDIVITQTPPVGIYVDDVYYASTLTTNLNNFEGIQQVEVLDGPQGTLYGRNTTGGAVKITTVLPDYSGVSGTLKLGYGNYDDRIVSGSVNLPLIDNKLALNLTGQYNAHNGYGRDIGNGVDLERLKNESLRATLRFDVTDDFQLVARAEWGHATGTQNINDLVYVAPGFSIAAASVAAQIGVLQPGDFAILGGLLTKGAPPAGTTLAQLETFFADVNKGRSALAGYICPHCTNVTYSTPASLTPFGLGGSAPIVPSSVANVSTYSITGTYQLPHDMYFKSITAYQGTSRRSIADTDGTPFLLVGGVSDSQDPHQITQELQLGGTSFGDQLKWLGGYYYYHLAGNDNADPTIQIVPFQPNPVTDLANFTDTSNSVFGQATYAILPTVHFTAGVRYTTERTKLEIGSFNAAECTVQGVPLDATGAACSNSFYNSFNNTSYTGGFDWNLTDDVLLYIKTSSGFRAGGTNQRSDPALPFKPETVTDYEFGAKSEWLDRRLRANLAVYRSNYKDIQRSVLSFSNGAEVTAIQNAASAKINGAELTVTALPIAPLRLNLSLAYTAPKYDSYTGLSPTTGLPVDLSGNAFPDVSKWQGSVGATYTLSDPIGDAAATLGYSFRSKVDYNPDDHTTESAPYVIQSGYGLLDARITQEIKTWNSVVGIWAKNLTNRPYYSGADDFATTLGYAFAIPGNPRTFGVDVRKNF